MSAAIAIRNVQVYDGTGAKPFVADVSIADGRIKSIGGAESALVEIDGSGLALSPGFIDVHSHDDGAFLRYPGMEFKLAQGVTTVVAGNCGFSAIPFDITRDPVGASGGILAGLQGGFTDLSGYFAAVLDKKPAINNLMLVGHNTVRALVLGMEPKTPTSKELLAMRAMVEQAMEQGACGFSTGLIYRPGRWSTTEEVIELTKAVTAFEGLYTTHMRNEGAKLLESVEETLRIGQEAKVHAHISHHKAAGKPNWGLVKSSLQRVERAKANGQRVTLDVYPYTAGSGRMIEYFNLDRIDADLAQVIRLASCPAFRDLEGRMVVDIAAERGMTPSDVVRMILTAPGGDRTICIQFIIDEADVETNLLYPEMMVGSDGIPDLRGKPHPRLFGTFPKVLGEYVRERGVLTLEDAIYRMTLLSARTFGMQDRGVLREGYWADVVLFDAKRIKDKATYDDPKQEPSGIEAVLVNGEIAFRGGAHTGVGAGKMLRYRRTAFGD